MLDKGSTGTNLFQTMVFSCERVNQGNTTSGNKYRASGVAQCSPNNVIVRVLYLISLLKYYALK